MTPRQILAVLAILLTVLALAGWGSGVPILALAVLLVAIALLL